MSAEDTETKAVEVEVDDDEEETPVQTGESAKEGAQLDSITDLVEEKELNQKKVNDVRSCRDTHVQGHGVRGGAERGRVGRGIVSVRWHGASARWSKDRARWCRFLLPARESYASCYLPSRVSLCHHPMLKSTPTRVSLSVPHSMVLPSLAQACARARVHGLIHANEQWRRRLV